MKLLINSVNGKYFPLPKCVIQSFVDSASEQNLSSQETAELIYEGLTRLLKSNNMALGINDKVGSETHPLIFKEDLTP